MSCDFNFLLNLDVLVDDYIEEDKIPHNEDGHPTSDQSQK